MPLSLANHDLIASGVRWIDYDKTTRIKIAGIDDQKYQIAADRARRLISQSDARQSLHNISVSDADATEFDIQCQLMSRYIVLDWDGVTDEDGNETEFSSQKAEKLLKGNAAFFAWVLEQATKVAIDKAKEIADAKKKPLSASIGSVSGAASRKRKPSSTANLEA
jgi:hypothetical protein